MFAPVSRQVRSAALRIVGIYTFFAAIWIIVSDTVASRLAGDHNALTRIEVFKGWLFVLLTSLLLYKLISSNNRKLEQATALLQASEERFHTIYDSLNDAVFIHDAVSGRILDVNETACRLYGYSRDDLLHNGLQQVGTGKAPYSETEALAWIHRCAEGTPQRFEWITTIRQGQRLWVEVSMRRATISGENRVVVMVRDISDRKQAETQLALQQEQLTELNATLENRVKETIAELRYKDELLQQQSRHAAMGEMLNSIAHQWRQPLNNIAIYVQNMQLLRDTGEQTDEQHRADIQSIMAIIQYLSRTIDDFRSFFRHETQQHPFSVTGAVRKTINFATARFEEHGITCQLTADHDVVISGYQAEFIQALLNILNNTVDALNQVNDKARQVFVSVEVQGSRTVLLISDNGGGIEPEALPHIFEPYFTTKEPGEGTGIGLYMAKTIIEKHMAGSLSARNTADGAEFRIELPPTSAQSASLC